jgi:hypothetical protein
MSKTSKVLVKEYAREKSIEFLWREYQKKFTNAEEKQAVWEVIEEKSQCPECGSDLLYDENDESLFCPADGTELK